MSTVAFLLFWFALNKIWAIYRITAGDCSYTHVLLAVEGAMKRLGVLERQHANTVNCLLDFAAVVMEALHFLLIALMVLLGLQIRDGGKQNFFLKRLLLLRTHVLPLSSDFTENIALTRLISHTITHFFKARLKRLR